MIMFENLWNVSQDFFCIHLSTVTFPRKFRMSSQRELFTTAAHLHLAEGREQLTRTNDDGVQTVHERLTAFTASLIRFYNHKANRARAFGWFGGLYELPTRTLLSATTSCGALVVTDITVVSCHTLTTFGLIFLSTYNANTPRQSTTL